jgi:hypothetical protein
MNPSNGQTGRVPIGTVRKEEMIPIMIKIELSGSGEEVRNEMLRLLGLQEPKVQTESPAKEETSKTAEAQPEPTEVEHTRKGRKPAIHTQPAWTEEEAESLLNQIKPNAKRIMVELANKPEGYRKSELVQVLGLKEGALRGQLSSVGNAIKKMEKKTSPISREKVDGELTYKLDSVVAGVAKQQSE